MVLPHSGSRLVSLTVEGANIEDLEIEPGEASLVTSKPSAPFVDPAIVSYQRPAPKSAPITTKDTHPIQPSDYPQVQPKSVPNPLPLDSTVLLPLDTKPKDDSVHLPADQEDLASATLTQPFNDFSLNGDSQTSKDMGQRVEISPRDEVSPEQEEIQSIQMPVKNSGRRNRRGNQKGKVMDRRSLPTVIPSQTVGLYPTVIPSQTVGQYPMTPIVIPSQTVGQYPTTPTVSRAHGGLKRPKGWRQTLLTEDTSQSNLQPHQVNAEHSTQTQRLRSKKKSQHHQLRINEDQNGWATGEASDIQDMGDFDFQGNLSKFDKRGVFDQIRQEDTTADEARLVSFNRLPARPGTAGGRNLHYTENVLGSPKANSQWNSGDSEKDISEARFSSGRSSRKNVLKMPPSRKGSSILASDQYVAVPGSLPDPKTKARYSSHDQVGSPTSMPHQPTSRDKPMTRSRPSLRISPLNHICPCVTPLQMAELEQLAVSELGLTDDIITENAARGIAQMARKIAVLEGEENGLAHNSSQPLVVILVGNNKSGARAVAAGRHLRNHAARVLVCILGLDHEEDLLDSVRRQLNIYRNCGGIVTKADGLSKSLKHLQAPTELIIDALLGMHMSFDDLRADDQTAYFQLANWANGSDVSVLAIDVPSGLDAASGKVFFHLRKYYANYG